MTILSGFIEDKGIDQFLIPRLIVWFIYAKMHGEFYDT